MKLIYKCGEPATFFFFLDSISNWSIHVRKHIKSYYEKRFTLTNQEKELIKKYKLIRKKHPWRQLDSDFIPVQSFNTV